MQETLKSLGLSNNEISIYLSLLKNPKSTGAALKRLTKISNSRVYSSLDTLIGKGLVTYERISTGRLFSAVDPKVLVEIAEDHKKKVTELIPFLHQMQCQDVEGTKTQVYEGLKGFNSALQNFMECSDGSTIDILAFSDIAHRKKELLDLLQRINNKLLLKNMKIRIIADYNSVIKGIPHYQNKTEVRYMPKGYVSPCAIDICEDKVGIFIWGSAPYAFFIENEQVANGFKNYFNFLWSIAKEK